MGFLESFRVSMSVREVEAGFEEGHTSGHWALAYVARLEGSID